jgi:hypothetical protein
VRYADTSDLKRLLAAGAGNKPLRDACECLLTSLHGPTAALQRLEATALVCAHQPHLAGHLLRESVEIFRSEWGIRRAEMVIQIGQALSREAGAEQRVGPDAVRWLREELPGLVDLIDKLLVGCAM